MLRRSVPGIFWLGLLIMPLSADQSNNPTYLALGDSIAFGYNPLLPVTNPDNFIGYPELVAASKRVQHVKKLVNAGCPGETSASFRSTTVIDAGCNFSLTGDPLGGYKDAGLLHVAYQEAQLDFAVATLIREKQIGLVTLSLGGNDLLLLQKRCNDQAACIQSGLPAVLAAYYQNMTAILNALRTQADYKDRIVLLTYFSPNYQDPIQTGAVAALNIVMLKLVADQALRGFDTGIADGFGTFALTSAFYGGNTCTAGLLIKLPNGTCDVHPSPKGAQLLANAVLNAIGN